MFEEQVINDALKEEKENLCIGVLDIYGFEIFKVRVIKYCFYLI